MRTPIIAPLAFDNPDPRVNVPQRRRVIGKQPCLFCIIIVFMIFIRTLQTDGKGGMLLSVCFSWTVRDLF